MQAFEYVAPTTIKDALELLSDKNLPARSLAGGTDLLVQLRGGKYDLGRVVDIKAIPELNQLSFDAREGLTIGAAVPCYQLYGNPIVTSNYPGIKDAASLIGGTQIQGRATLGGNLCNSAPSADAIPSLIASRATCQILTAKGMREVDVEDFCTGPSKNVLETGELLMSLKIPPPATNTGTHYLRFIPRNEMDIAVVGVGVSVTLDEDRRRFTAARIGLASVAPTPLLIGDAEKHLINKEVTDQSISEAAEIAMEAARPITDMRGTIEYRRHLVGVLTRRALKQAIERAMEG